MRNRYAGKCYRCGVTVAPGAGHFERHPTASGKWRTQHADCAIRWRGKQAATRQQTKPSPTSDEIEETMVLSEDDIEALHADWCLDGRGFGEDQP